MSQHTKKYQVFISSTYEDLKEERAAVIQTLLRVGCIPASMEQFPASDMSPMGYIEKMLENCDYFILLLAGRYGSIIPGEDIGYTEKEYDYAISNCIPVMAFVLKDIDSLDEEKQETNKDKKEKLLKFREKVCKNKMVIKFSSKNDLITGVATSLLHYINDYPRNGWIRGNTTTVEQTVEQQIEKYLEAHTITKQEIDEIEITSLECDDNLELIDQDTGKTVKSITVITPKHHP